MKKYKRIVSHEDCLESVVCDCCGFEIKKNEYGEMGDYFSVEKRWGYGTSLDGEVHSFDLCEKCYKSKISDVKILPDRV